MEIFRDEHESWMMTERTIGSSCEKPRSPWLISADHCSFHNFVIRGLLMRSYLFDCPAWAVFFDSLNQGYFFLF